jgi:polyhydroxybutyrate depolymerase
MLLSFLKTITMKKIQSSFFAMLMLLISGNGILLQGCKKDSQEPTPTEEKRIDHTITVEGVTRSFIVYQPPNSLPGEKLPLVFMFHGSGGNGEKFYNISGWKEKAAKEKFYAVFPSALAYCTVNANDTTNTATHWASYEFDAGLCPGQTVKDDVLFVREMTKFLQENYSIDEKRRYINGFSNGGQFAFRLAIEAPDLFAATSIFGAALLTPNKIPGELIPVYQGVGNIDRLFLAGAQRLEPFPMDASLLDIPLFSYNMQNACRTFRLKNEYTFRTPPLYTTFAYTIPSGSSTNSFYFHLFNGLDHQYPNGINYPLSAAELIWDFLKEYSK